MTLLHWPLEPAVLTPLIPPPLEADTLDGVAWVSLTPFSTTCEVAGVLPLPGPRRFPETNLRTYVRGPDGRDALLFLSLDVTNAANALLGRCLRLPYHRSDLAIDRASDLRYSGARGGRPRTDYDITVVPGARKDGNALDVFLTGRWSAYVVVQGLVVRHDVHHEPWPLHDVRVVHCSERFSVAAGLDLAGPPAIAHFAPAVSARIAPANVAFARTRPGKEHTGR